MHSPLRPLAHARRIHVFVPGSRDALTPHAIEELFAHADVLVEGDIDAGGDGDWFGTVLLTFDLARLVSRSRDLSFADADRAVRAIEGSVRVRLRGHRLGRAEVQRRFPDATLGTALVESRFDRRGERLLLDVDLEIRRDVFEPAPRTRRHQPHGAIGGVES